LVQGSSYDINEEADEVCKQSNNKKYPIVMVLATIFDFALSTDGKSKSILDTLLIAIEA
jgi:hypothetical protein